MSSSSFNSIRKKRETHLLDHHESMIIISLKSVSANRDKDGESVLQHDSRRESSKVRDKNQTLLERLRILGICDFHKKERETDEKR